MNLTTIEGTFLEESSNRFLCKVLINNTIEECYVPSSSKLSNYIKLKNKKVLLTTNMNPKARTKYSLFAVKYYNKYILLNLNLVNKLLLNYLIGNDVNHSFKCEHRIEKYKCDIFFPDYKHIIEAKGIICTTKTCVFPLVSSDRSINQLKEISNLLKQGYKASYYLVSLSPIVKSINLNKEDEFTNLIYECINQGMYLYGLKIEYTNKRIKYSKIKIKGV